ncbi:acyl-CoA hydrolase [Pseudozyma hubeiensis SY62]|uniref:Acyl-CoA hydrolase n=1 Tax=Pseudozyma hubeiensis (strain SY62) TaxID=1305764 RepID=R9P099_PSEHS|nr:acyl-CoA hydrolase [Pseudozyma hubeiensis SY62]GAC94551.1 acyl-CoA hydrolase [Pseudozyma hubeiensis SY62]
MAPTWRDANASQLYTAGIVGVGAFFLLLSTANVASALLQSIAQQKRAEGQAADPSRSDSNHGRTASASSNHGGAERTSKQGKTTDESTVLVTYPITVEMCDNAFHLGPSFSGPSSFASTTDEAADQLPKIRAGALFKLIDVVAGVSARKHAELSCVTVSVDSVLLLAPIYLGDLVHLSASVNRAWGSSLEVGIRVVKEDPRSGAREYVSHAYMTFVAISSPPSAASSSSPQPPARVRLASRPSLAPASVWQQLASFFPSSRKPAKAPKPQLLPLLPKTPLEARRHILAGRRRAKRIAMAKKGEARDGVSTQVKQKLKQEVQEISRTGGKWSGPAETELNTWTPGRLKIEQADLLSSAIGSDVSAIRGVKTSQECQLEALELEFVVQAYVSRDPAVTVKHDEGMVEINLAGDIPLRHPLKVVERLAEQLEQEQQQQQRQAGDASSDSLFATMIPESGSMPLPSPSAPRTARPNFAAAAMIKNGSISPPMSPLARRRSLFLPLKAAQEREGESDLDQSLAGTPIKQHMSQSLTRAKLAAKLSKPIKVAKTMARTLHLVFPEHTNSVGVLFGGQLMDWMEEAALLSVRHVGRGRRWGTVSLDGLEFEQAVAVGESMTFTAVVVRTFVQSCEVYVLAEAESRNGTKRITNDALFTLAFPLDQEDVASQVKGGRARLLRQVEMPEGSALAEFADVAVRRRETRLELKQMLVRIYSNPN